jgi:prolyl oligopeptidase
MGTRSRALARTLPVALAIVSGCMAHETDRSSTAPVSEELHGVHIDDPWRWLEDASSPKVQEWMRMQDAAARAALASYPGRDRLAARFRELFYVDSISAPTVRNGRLFYTRTFADKEKAIVYWKQGEAGAEQVLLDPNGWSKDETVSLGSWTPSWDGRRVVYGRRENGEDEATLHVIDVDTGVVSPVDVIPGGKYASPSWTPDSSAFYYEYLPSGPSISVADRPGYTEIRLHKLGTDPKQDPLIHPRTGDPSTFLGQSLSRDGRYLFIYVQHGWNSTDVWLRDLQKVDDFRQVVVGRNANYGVVEWQGDIYIQSDEDASRGRVFKTSAATPERDHWRVLVPEDPEATLQEMSVMGGRLALSYLRDAASEIRVASLEGTDPVRVVLPGIGSTSGIVGNPDSDDAYFAFTSFTTPRQIYRLSMASLATRLWAEIKLPIDPSKFAVDQAFFSSLDGTRIPMFIVHKKGMALDGNNPALLTGYGGFNISLTPDFRASIYPWLEAGGVYAVANLRGGGEYGKEWHDAGRGDRKQNVFNDFAAAAQYLVRAGWTKPERLGINGGSNGGLLVGAAMTQHPELFGAVVCQVPLLDMLRYHLFGSGKTWVPEYGSADNPDQFQTLRSYSPYHHIHAGLHYPPLLMMSADHDDRVDPMHARKFAAAMEAAEASSGKPSVLLRIEHNAGHGGADQVRQAIQLSADMYAFLFHTLGVTVPGAASAPSAAGAPR